MLRFRIATLLVAFCTLSYAGTARGETVLVLHGHHVRAVHERFLGRTELPRMAVARASATRKPPHGKATRQALDGLLAAGQIDQPTHDARMVTLNDALSAYRSLTGTRKVQLGAVLDNADSISASGQLTPSRLNAVFATIDANTTWWTNGPLLANGQRVSVEGSPLIWQYYTGQGIELQMLANFGKANALWSGHKTNALRAFMNAIVPLAADHGGWPAWEYYFAIYGGKPPWISAISQGTAIQALARAGQLFGDPTLISTGAAALAAFEQPPPNGVRVDTATGPFYVIYSFQPDEHVINAHLQALVGLFDFAQITGDARALGLFQQGDAEAQAVLPSYDTGAWSLYDQTSESDLSYHNLVTGFLQNLCKRTSTPIYCDTAARFKGYLTTPPVISAASQRVRAGAPAKIAFTLNKISRVGMIISQGAQTVLSTSAVVGHGTRTFAWSRQAAPGVYQLRVTATDLAGNAAQPATATLRILPPRRKKH